MKFKNPDINKVYQDSFLSSCDLEYLIEQLNYHIPVYSSLTEEDIKEIIKVLIKSSNPRLRFYG